MALMADNFHLLTQFISSQGPYFLFKISWILGLEKDCLCYNLQDHRVGQVKEPYIGLTQENLIENSVQDCLSYIQIPNSPCELFLAYPR